MTAPGAWPPLPYADWEPTKQTLHRYTQMVGKVRMALVPFRNHWWHVTLYVSTRGLTTGPMPHGDRHAEIELDLLEHRAVVRTSDGGERSFDMPASSACADFHAELFAALSALGVDVAIRAEPFDLGDSPAFPDDRIHDSYDPDAVTRYWRVLASTDRVLGRLRSGFAGKASPVHLFWHSFDLAHARYSGRRAPVAEGADRISAEAYSHEVVAFGFWPGDERTTPFPAFYSYTAPEPGGLREHPLAPAAASWQPAGAGSLALLPYDEVRAAADPDATLLAFYESAFAAGASAAEWDLESTAPLTR
ncbi:MAG: Ava_C0101 and related proteins [uncultured Solirubrobacteraceae bacterium]|uniref:Ava_C0101 and related proteins n=1 Tax=uncultured Solirubrobacteraceae bacterium TaxID=1162706 RepID=A0A6J4TSA9_9ACTN|nr:MAG: Ava_C0101 and related proteins [uncultured Solirubrobacteraceae bacterium]